jgi:CcdB protein.
MAQFDVFRNPNPGTRASYPYLLDVQSLLFRDLSTRVVIPLAIASTEREAMQRLTPMLEVRGERLLLMTPQLAGVTLDALGEFVESVADQRDLIVNALDFLLTGS